MDVFSWHRTLNKKKVAIVVGILVAILAIIIGFLIGIHNDKKDESLYSIATDTEHPNDIFYDNDNTISIEVSKLYQLKQFTPKENYLIELRSENNLDIFVSKEPKFENKDLKSVASADNKAYSESFEKTSNLSELKELTVDEKSAYTYSLHYLDQNLNKAFYLQVVWTEYDDGYYVFDFEFPLNDLSAYSNIVTDTLKNFKKL